MNAAEREELDQREGAASEAHWDGILRQRAFVEAESQREGAESEIMTNARLKRLSLPPESFVASPLICRDYESMMRDKARYEREIREVQADQLRMKHEVELKILKAECDLAHENSLGSFLRSSSLIMSMGIMGWALANVIHALMSWLSAARW